jgi:hypothetical protein
VAIAVCATVWVVASTLFFKSGGFNPAGLIPTVGCLIALWGAYRSEVSVMWLGTAIVVITAILFLFSIGLAVVPAGIALVVGSFVLSRTRAATTT